VYLIQTPTLKDTPEAPMQAAARLKQLGKLRWAGRLLLRREAPPVEVEGRRAICVADLCAAPFADPSTCPSHTARFSLVQVISETPNKTSTLTPTPNPPPPTPPHTAKMRS